MSHEASGIAAKARPETGIQKCVLLALGNCHSAETGQCNPSVKWLAEWTGFSVRSVRSAVAALENQGYIIRHERRAKSGYQVSTQYEIIGASESDPKGRQPVHPTECNPCTPLETGNPETSPVPVSSGSTEPSSTETSLFEFSHFWKDYPRKISKPHALNAFKRAIKNGATAEEILAGLERHRTAWEQTDPEFIPHPATWLNGERWNDPPPACAASRTAALIEEALANDR